MPKIPSQGSNKDPVSKKRRTGGSSNAHSKDILETPTGLQSAKQVETSRDNRRSGQATRTLKACESCRKQKVRCIKYDNSRVCVRCSYLNKQCSFEPDSAFANVGISMTPATSMASDSGGELRSGNNESMNNTKLDMIYNGVNEILKRLNQAGSNSSLNITNPSHSEISSNDARLLLEAASSMKKSSVPSTPHAPVPVSASASHMVENRQYPYRFPSPQIFQPTSKNDIIDNGPLGDDFEDITGSFKCASASLKTSPFSFIHNQNHSNTHLTPYPILSLFNSLNPLLSTRNYFNTNDDVISMGILSVMEAIDLIDDFRRNYGRWVSFPLSIPTGVLIERIRFKSSFLLTTCLVLSLRYLLNESPSNGNSTELKDKRRTYSLLMRQLVIDLDKSLLKYASFQGVKRNGGDIEFLQALVILSIYLLSLLSVISGNKNDDDLIGEFDLSEVNLDPWYLSGIGLTTFITKLTYGSLFRRNESASANSAKDDHDDILSPFTILYDELDSDEYQTLTILRIYNHLILVHLINCIFSGRMCVVDEIRLNYCTATLSLPSATNFDGRMVSEIEILLVAYNYIQVNMNSGGVRTNDEIEASFASVKEEINIWYDQWEYLFSQPALQFVELCYHFCLVMVYYTYTYRSSSIKLKPNTQFYDHDNIEYILRAGKEQSIYRMIQHAYLLVKSINVIENDSYFAYLSDQIHFCFYFSAMVLVKLLKHMNDSSLMKILDVDHDDNFYINSENWQSMLDDVRLLLEKFGRIGGANEEDILIKYKVSLASLLDEL